MIEKPPTNIAGYDPVATKDGNFVFDAAKANKVLVFAERYITHVKGSKARQPLKLESWQRDLLATLFGWVHKETGLRRYRECLIEVSRKSGKTTICALIALYMLCADNEHGAEVYLAANSRDQASHLYDISCGMIRQNKALSSRLKIFESRKRVLYQKTNSYLQTIAAEAGTAHGTNSHCVIYDELAQAPNDKLYEALATSFGARSQPLLCVISTSGHDRQSVMYRLHERAIKIRDGVEQDPTYLPCVYSAPDDVDWRSQEQWFKYAPNLGVSVGLEYYERESAKAQQMPSYENSFRQLYLCQWVQQATRWIPQAHWADCKNESWPDLTNVACFGGLDLSSTIDTSAFNLAWPLDGKLYVKTWFWCPRDNAKAIKERYKVRYDLWERDPQAQLVLTPGNAIDKDFIEKEILTLHERYKVKGIYYDRYNADQLVIHLTGAGVTMNPIGQGFVSLNAPCKELERLVLTHSLVNDNPLLTWQVSNVEVVTDAAGNIKPIKGDHKSHLKIDGVSALLNSIAGVLGDQDEFFALPQFTV